MYKTHNLIEAPKNEEAKIWRYMDFTKLVSLLDKRALFFSIPENLSDPFEGSLSKLSIKQRENFIKSVPEFSDAPELHLQSTKLPLINARRFMLLNCWHMNEYQSAAMWKLYLKSNEGVAIQSTFIKLKESFNKYEKDVYIGKVRYVDFDKDFIPYSNILALYFSKRQSFAYEQELRAAIMGSAKSAKKDGGEYIPVDLQFLIERIFVSPAAPKWFEEVVISTVRKYGIKTTVNQSDLTGSPLY